jgi:hypothetical protein
MADKFSEYAGAAPGGPMTGGFAITKSDTTVFAQPTRAVWVGGAGNLAVVYLDGTTDTITGVPAGTMLNIRVTQVMSTNTTASEISGLY